MVPNIVSEHMLPLELRVFQVNDAGGEDDGGGDG